MVKTSMTLRLWKKASFKAPAISDLNSNTAELTPFHSHFRGELLRTGAAYLQHSVWEESRKITTGSVEQLGLSTWDEVSSTQNQLFYEIYWAKSKFNRPILRNPEIAGCFFSSLESLDISTSLEWCRITKHSPDFSTINSWVQKL